MRRHMGRVRLQIAGHWTAQMTTLLKKTLARTTGRTRPTSLTAAGPDAHAERARTRDLQIAAVSLGALTRPSGW